jgi:hypothetical protein
MSSPSCTRQRNVLPHCGHSSSRTPPKIESRMSLSMASKRSGSSLSSSLGLVSTSCKREASIFRARAISWRSDDESQVSMPVSISCNRATGKWLSFARAGMDRPRHSLIVVSLRAKVEPKSTSLGRELVMILVLGSKIISSLDGASIRCRLSVAR